MDGQVKDLFQVISWFVGSVGGVIAALLAIRQMYQNRLQRIIELRWKQAGLAKEILDRMFSDKKAGHTMKMLDWSGRDYEIDDGKKEQIYNEDVWSSLRTTDLRFNDKSVYIRDCFDNFFYYLDMLEHYVRTRLVRFEDLKHPLEYYMKKMAEKKGVVENFLNEYDYALALSFLNRFESWKETGRG